MDDLHDVSSSDQNIIRITTNLVGIFLVNIIFNGYCTELGEVLGRNLDQIGDGSLPAVSERLFQAVSHKDIQE